ncbi:M14 family metallopeptidase [Lysobacter sp. S4-A87]|uniref:M14 family metallopeptidase n=1 Tax=Lysobacter sp. S4-A87 TaxID=2925843 RepID=UPI001F53260F|nr:M14 family metallopeptidase [Lysobacter sp. S4-A87]UNK48828.1 M14 family metallopeptidase [Lysobacter sp. S4-A87]
MPQPSPLTRAESSDYTYTSRHADVMAFIDELAARNDPRLRISDFGQTPEGRTLPLLVLSASGVDSPEQARQLGLPVVLVMCGIHAGEVEGKEAGLMYVRDLLDGAHGDVLSRLTLLLVPLFNADGNERIDPENRRLDIAHFTGQLGPDTGVGTRVNAAGINLNRDYMRQQAPEMRLLQTRVMHRWNPHLSIDCHATNGSIHRFDLTYDIPHTALSGRSEPVDYMREQLLPAVTAAVKERDGRDTFYYGNFLRDEGGEGSGWITYTHHPRFGGNYRGLCNRLDLLLETYAYISFEQRVLTTYAFIRETLAYVGEHGAQIVELLANCEMPPDDIAVSYRLEPFDNLEVEVLTRQPYVLEGDPIAVKVPYIGRFVGEHVVQRPLAYAVPEDVAARLEGHGLVVERPPAPPQLDAEIATITAHGSSAGREILEADEVPVLEAEYRRERRELPRGWALVRTEQQRGAVAVYLCEAGSDDGLLACQWIQAPDVGSEFPAWRVRAIEHA